MKLEDYIFANPFEYKNSWIDHMSVVAPCFEREDFELILDAIQNKILVTVEWGDPHLFYSQGYSELDRCVLNRLQNTDIVNPTITRMTLYRPGWTRSAFANYRTFSIPSQKKEMINFITQS